MNSIQKHVGDLLGVSSGILVHGCNARGVMGAGVAKAVKTKYPGAYSAYRKAYSKRGLYVGEVIAYRAPGNLVLLIANAITQVDYGIDRVQVDYAGLEQCFLSVANLARLYRVADVHFPLIGCGLAGGDWGKVEPIIERTLEGLNKHLWVLESD